MKLFEGSDVHGGGGGCRLLSISVKLLALTMFFLKESLSDLLLLFSFFAFKFFIFFITKVSIGDSLVEFVSADLGWLRSFLLKQLPDLG